MSEENEGREDDNDFRHQFDNGASPVSSNIEYFPRDFLIYELGFFIFF